MQLVVRAVVGRGCSTVRRCRAGLAGKVLFRRTVVAAFIFAVAAAHMVGKVLAGFQVDVAFKGFVAVPAFGASLAYFDSYRQERLPANLLQAQRDYFGAHTYERIDKPGTFHTEWLG